MAGDTVRLYFQEGQALVMVAIGTPFRLFSVPVLYLRDKMQARYLCNLLIYLVGPVGLEPTTKGL